MKAAAQPEASVPPAPAGLPEVASVGRLRPATMALLVVGAVASFQLAFQFAPLCWLVLAYLGCLYELRRVATARQAFYGGMVVGLGVFVPQMGFLWTIFGPAAAPLWLILAFFHGVFLLLLHRVEVRLGAGWALWLAPVLWCGIEYFRSEVWWLRFTWFSAGSTVRSAPLLWSFGVYGVGFVAMAVAAMTVSARRKQRAVRWIVVLSLIPLLYGIGGPILLSVAKKKSVPLKIAGVQLEFPGHPEVLTALDRVAKAHPEAELLMLSEYTFDGPVPDSVKAWCRRNVKWLVAGGKDVFQAGDSPGKPLLGPLTGATTERYYNTAFVISTNGEVVFMQAKSRPIQFFKDGEPAREQRVWESPWGKLGIAICYDVSYRRVMDGLIRQGARALLIPTMDVETWGEHEHRLNAHMAKIRAAEYEVPIFRVASSGISQWIGPDGQERETTRFPGPGEMIAGELRLRYSPATIPPDRWLAPACSVGTVCVLASLAVLAWRDRSLRKGVR